MSRNTMRGKPGQQLSIYCTRLKLPVCAAFCSGTGLRSRNSQTCTTRFRISELGNLVQMFRHFRYGVSVRLTNHSYRDSCFRWFMGVKIMFTLIETSPRLGIIPRWGPLPISMVLRSAKSPKSEILSLARTCKYVKNTSVLSINKSEEDS